MKKYKNILITALFAVVFSIISYVNTMAAGESVDILFTSDLHSYVDSYDVMVEGQQKNVGGFARLKTLVDEKKASNPDILLVDCGDEVMGTLPQVLFDKEALELCFLSEMGFDAITVGNHEFDYGAESLANMYRIAASRYSDRPDFVQCNIDWNQEDEYTNTLKAGLAEFGYKDYTIVEKGGVKIAIVGVLGIDAIKCSPTCELTFSTPIDAVKKTVEKIKQNEQVDMIVCLSHSGTGDVLGDTEDEKLAKAVPDIDVIISGHTHTVLDEYITVGKTYIVSLGSYGLYTGTLNLTKNSENRWDLNDYKLVLMDESISEDQGVLEKIEESKKIIDSDILSAYGFSANQVIAYNEDIDFETPEENENLHQEMKIGNILSDAYRYAANSTPTGQERLFDVAVCPSGTVRSYFVKGDITVAKAFETLSLGIGPDGKVGYPLVSLYLTGNELKTMAEVDASISDLMPTARLHTSGVCFQFNPNRMLLNKVNDIWLCGPILEESRTEIEKDKLYRVVTDYYSMSMLGAVTDMSKGLLSIVPKNADGSKIEDFDSVIIYDAGGNELKAWIALAEYLESFPAGPNGVSVIPEYYNVNHNRKVIDDSWNVVSLFKNSNKFLFIVILLIVIIILLMVAVVRVIVKSKSRKKVFIG